MWNGECGMVKGAVRGAAFGGMRTHVGLTERALRVEMGRAMRESAGLGRSPTNPAGGAIECGMVNVEW